MKLEDFFAFESFRSGQRELADQIYEACKTGHCIIAEAMSGFGKTAAVLSGTPMAAYELDMRIIYTCRTKREVLRVTDEFSNLQRRMVLKATHLFSKYDYCLLMRRTHLDLTTDSFKWYCSFNVSNNMCSYFLNTSFLGDRLTEAVQQTVLHSPTQNDILGRGEELHACPYEVAKLAIAEAKVIVVPYQYLFDESARAILLNCSMLSPPRTILVIDEAHNLRDFVARVSANSLKLELIHQALLEAELFALDKLVKSLRILKDRVSHAILETHEWVCRQGIFCQGNLRKP